MTGKCKSCPEFLQKMKEEAPLDEVTTQYELEQVTQQVHEGEERTTTKMTKVIKEGTIEEALDILKTKMPSFRTQICVFHS